MPHPYQVLQRVVLTLVLAWVAPFALCADDRTIVFGHPPSGFGPFTTVGKVEPTAGIMVEVARAIGRAHGYKVITESIPRKRSYERLRKELFDVAAIAREWVETPEDFAFSDPVVVLRDVVYSTREQPVAFRQASDLFGKRIGTHRGYVYPTLDEYFESGKMERDDSASELAMLKKLLADRSDAAIVEQTTGAWIIRQQGWQREFQISEEAVDTVDFRLMFSRKWAAMMPAFNRELARMRSSGELDDILARYR